ncbi:unnamed protein product [Ectocarpus sp. CCAP 1310/34]|nr:unnamed protein product [Ectocarpus sp. CCAP 1310/34]
MMQVHNQGTQVIRAITTPNTYIDIQEKKRVHAPRFDAVRMMRFRCSGAAAPEPLLRCRCGQS